MQPSDLPTFRNALARVAIATRTELDKPTIRVYEDNLMDLPLAAIVRTLRKLESRSEFFPKLPIIREGVESEVQSQATAYLPVGERQIACVTCEDLRFVEVPPQLVEDGVRPPRFVKPCPDCNSRRMA